MVGLRLNSVLQDSVAVLSECLILVEPRSSLFSIELRQIDMLYYLIEPLRPINWFISTTFELVHLKKLLVEVESPSILG